MQYWFNLLLKNQGSRLYIGIFWAFFTAVSGVALLALSGWFITATALSGLALAAGLMVMFDMYIPGSGIRFFALSRTVSRYIERIYNHDTILRLISTFRLSLFKGLSSLPLAQLRSTSDSEWLGKLTADLDALDSILIRYTIPPIAATLLIVVITFFLSFIWLELALFLGGFLLLCCLLSIGLTIGRTKNVALLSASLLNELRADIISHLQGAFVLQSQQLMALHENQMLERMKAFHGLQASLNNKLANIQLLLDLVLGVALIALVTLGLYAVQSTIIDGPTAVMLVLLFLGASEVLQVMPSQFSSWGKTSFSANRLKALAQPQADETSDEAIDIASIHMHINHHSRLAISQTQALTLSLNKQQLLLVLGRSGSGKSTIANLLVGIESAQEQQSEIRINENTQLSSIAPSNWHKNLGYLEQSNVILAGTLAYNLRLGIADVSEAQLWQVLKMVELADWAESLPKGLNTWLGETGGKVSGGQARRISLCRIILRDPQLVILDEPFNGLDSDMAARIWHNIAPWISHRMTVLLMHERPAYVGGAIEALCLDVLHN